MLDMMSAVGMVVYLVEKMVEVKVEKLVVSLVEL